MRKLLAVLLALLAIPAYAQRAGHFGDQIREAIVQVSPTQTASWTSATSDETVLQLDVRGYCMVTWALTVTNPGVDITAGDVAFEVSVQDTPTRWLAIQSYIDVYKTTGAGLSLALDPTSGHVFTGAAKHFRIRLNTVIVGTGTAIFDMAAVSACAPQAVSIQNGGVPVAGVLPEGSSTLSSINPVQMAGSDSGNLIRTLSTDTSGDLQIDVLTFPADVEIRVADSAGNQIESATAAPAAGARGWVVRQIGRCKNELNSYVSIDIVTATTTLIVTGVGGQHVYICSVVLMTAGANNVAFVAGTGATCATSTAGMAGGATAAEGFNLAANGGFSLGNGDAAVMSTNITGGATGDSVCIITSAAVQLSGVIGYVIE